MVFKYNQDKLAGAEIEMFGCEESYTSICYALSDELIKKARE